ncbi:MAG: hypothetical protein AB7P69_08350 [Candidatus Binatia bacterium]
MKYPRIAPLTPLVPLLLIFLFVAPFLSSCGDGHGAKEKESQRRQERITPFNEEVDEVRALRERVQ